METMIIGIAGGTGSGKTTLTLRLKEHFGEDVSILYHDNYYKQHDDMPYEERCRLNYDHPDAFDTELLIADLQALRRGEAVHSPTYDYTVHNRAAETVEVRPARVILVEGILIFVDPALRELMDIKLFVDTDADVRILLRGIEAAQGEEPAADDGTGAQPEQGQQSNQQLHPPPVRQIGEQAEGHPEHRVRVAAQPQAAAQGGAAALP